MQKSTVTMWHKIAQTKITSTLDSHKKQNKKWRSVLDVMRQASKSSQHASAVKPRANNHIALKNHSGRWSQHLWRAEVVCTSIQITVAYMMSHH